MTDLPTSWYPRPDPPAPVGGYVWAAVEAGPDWRLAPQDKVYRCRAEAGYTKPACGRTAVAVLNRSRARGGQNWWAYCPDHMYGRWIEGQQVMQWVLREAPDA